MKGRKAFPAQNSFFRVVKEIYGKDDKKKKRWHKIRERETLIPHAQSIYNLEFTNVLYL